MLNKCNICSMNLGEVKFVNWSTSIAMAIVLSLNIQLITIKSITYGSSVEMNYVYVIGSILIFIGTPIYSILNYRYLVKLQIIISNKMEIYKLVMIPIFFFVLALIVAGLLIAQIS